jgi:hypothetical protein
MKCCSGAWCSGKIGCVVFLTSSLSEVQGELSWAELCRILDQRRPCPPCHASDAVTGNHKKKSVKRPERGVWSSLAAAYANVTATVTHTLESTVSLVWSGLTAAYANVTASVTHTHTGECCKSGLVWSGRCVCQCDRVSHTHTGEYCKSGLVWSGLVWSGRCVCQCDRVIQSHTHRTPAKLATL